MSAETQKVDVVRNQKLAAYIATRDRRIATKQPWSPTPLLDAFEELVTKGTVKVGGRASCGGAPDPTWLIFTSWNEVVRKARALGYDILEQNIKHQNKSPTMAGGFWNEIEYSLARVGGAA